MPEEQKKPYELSEKSKAARVLGATGRHQMLVDRLPPETVDKLAALCGDDLKFAAGLPAKVADLLDSKPENPEPPTKKPAKPEAKPQEN